jgi:homoserine acetyltransferase
MREWFQLQLKIINFIARDIARIFIEGLRVLKIDTLFALIGGSVGGVAWEILALEPKLAQNFIPSLQIESD